ncbi:MAG: N-acetylmuramoyl-L-alanine amidase [Gammaproteobacteria bacterium]|nr:N-acetylmuramoyl-L-alanine amidase [Gammaproteobacteria bacterium]
MPGKRHLRGTVLLIFMGLCAGAACGEPVQVQAARIASQSGKTRVALDLSQPAEHKLFTLSNPHRVVIDIKPGRITKQALPLPAGTGAVSRIRSANREDGSVRVVLDLKTPVKPRSFLLAGNGQQGDRLVIDLEPIGTASVAKKAADATPNGAVRQVPTAGREIVIAVDPGHGGKDPGARGPTGLREKDVVLRVSRELAGIINAAPGMRAYLTRNGDDFVHLRQRMERARTARADLFISLHADAFRDRRVRGATVYVLSSKGATDEAARRLAERENAADLIGGVRLDDKDQTLASVLLDLSQNASLSASIDAGDDILQEIRKITKVRKTKVQQAPFLVLKSPDVPSLLIETAFISNPSDEKNLGSQNYRERLARAIFAGVQAYFRSNPPAGSMMAQAQQSRKPGRVRHLIQRGDTLSGIADQYRVPVRRIRSVNNIDGDKIVVGKVLTIPVTQDI